MTSPSSPQYTPAQVLQAGRRAEAGGRPDYAIQFYRHLVQHHPATLEGTEARENLNRLTEFNRRSPLPAGPLMPHGEPNHVVPAPLEPRAGQGSDALARLSYRTESSAVVKRDPDEAESPLQVQYGMGRGTARLLSLAGMLIAGAGLALPIALFSGKNLGPFSLDVSGLPLGLVLAPLIVLIGLGAILVGQLAIALFDQVRGGRSLTPIDRTRL